MRLAALLEGVDFEIICGTTEKDVEAIIYHSEEACPHSVFFAIIGESTDGHDYIEPALEKGCDIFVIEKNIDQLTCGDSLRSDNITVINTPDVRKALALASRNFFGSPDEGLLTVGITGTKGKTTTAFMIKSIFEEAGLKTGIIGTVIKGFDENYQDSDNTTPQSLDIQKSMREMADGGCKAVVLEVSSQGLKQMRVWGMVFDIAVFTNLSPDHIGKCEHKDFEEYAYWKSRIFNQAKIAVINKDDTYWRKITEKSKAQKTVYFSGEGADIRLVNDSGILGTEFFFGGEKFLIGLPGIFNAYNALAALSVAKVVGISKNVAKEALRKVRVPGRAEPVNISDDFTVLVDYAHNGKALESILKALRQYDPDRLIVVFGCGGQRDKNRRFEMGDVAGRLADFSVITSDNPREEDPMEIIKDITTAMISACGSYNVIPDRREAITWTVREAQQGDIIVICGKGHETYQIIGKTKRHFDDREVILSVNRG